MANYMTAQEIGDASKRLALSCMPHSKQAVNRRAVSECWAQNSDLARKRTGTKGGGGIEYHVSLLPEAMQVKLEAKAINAVTILNTKETRAVDTIKREALDTTALTARQRLVMNARSMVLSAIESVQIDGGHTRSQAVDLFTTGVVDFGLAVETISAANDRKGGSRVISRSTLLRWFRFRDGTGIGALAPKATKERADVPAWFWDFLKHYARPQKPCATEALDAYLNSDKRPNETVTYDKILRLLKKLGNVEKHRGREGSLTLKSRQAYVTRSTGDLLPTCVYTSDGKTFDAEIAHPIHGRPFRPEITAVVDVAMRQQPPHSFEKKYELALKTLVQRQATTLHSGNTFALIIDEADHISANSRIMETIRDLSDMIEMPVILVGMGKIRNNLIRFPQIASRISQYVNFHPATFEDVRKFFDEICEVPVADDLVGFVHKVTGGMNREIKEAMAIIERFGRRNKPAEGGLTMVDMSGQLLVNDRATGQPTVVHKQLFGVNAGGATFGC